MMTETKARLSAAPLSRTATASPMDKFERVAWESEFAICLLASPDWTEFSLIDLTESLPSSETLSGFVTRRLHWVGIVGICDEHPVVALVVEPEDDSIALMSEAFVAHMLSGSAKQKAKNDIGFMERMYQLRRILEKN